MIEALSPFLQLLALLLILITIHDVLATVLSHGGAGLITRNWTRYTWKLILWTRYRLGFTSLIQYAGPFFLVAIIGVWYLLFNLAWFTLLYLGDYTVKGDTGRELEVLEVLYYLGSTFTTLGIGDYTPNGFPWTLVTTSGALVVTLLTSLSISYLIPVIGAVVDRRKMISAIDIIGETPEKILEAAWTGKDSGMLDSEVLNTSDSLVKESFRSHVYPVLGYFYFAGSHSSLNQAVLNLFDALNVQKLMPEREGNIVRSRLNYLLKAIDIYLVNMSELAEASKHPAAHQDFILLLKRQGLDLEKLPNEEVEVMLDKRKQLLFLTHLEGRCPIGEDGKIRRKDYFSLT